MLKVLISAYACEPDKGSEPGVGWNWAKQIAKFAEAWVITRANNSDSIEKALEKEPIFSNLHFVYYDPPKWLTFWKKKTKGLYLFYFLWQIGAYKVARRLHRKINFDAVHHLTFGNIWLPTFMPFLRIPFIWGPVGGGERVPEAFRKSYSMTAKTQERFRDIILSSLRMNLFFISTCRLSRIILVRTEETLQKIPDRYRDKTVKIIETGIALYKDRPIERSENKDVIILSVGRLIHLKGFDLAIRAFAKACRDRDNVRMIIIGEGPDKNRLLKIVNQEKISHKIFFKGNIPHDDVLDEMSRSSIFLFPSLKEGGAWVLYEAMVSSLPVICLDIGGPKEIITNQCGIKVKPITPEQTINDLAEALLKLANDPALRIKMGQAGRKRVQEYYTWEKKGEFIKKVYEEVLNKKLSGYS
jgi:glycosyltransferase involved in cell wall biosynthesis